jgi:hypothetical protein
MKQFSNRLVSLVDKYFLSMHNYSNKSRIKSISVIILILFTCINLFPQSFIVDTTFNLPGQVDTINTSSIDYKTVPGFFQLQTGENENLALRRSAYIVYQGKAPTDSALRNGNKLVDGSKSSPSFISILAGSQGAETGTYIIIDLQAVRNVKKLILYTFAGSPNLRPRGFSIFAGLDTLTMERVYQQLDNQVVNPIAEFDAIVSQYIKVVIDVIPQNFNTTITEIEVFGEGFLPQGFFYSSVRDIGQNVNFGTFEFNANIPEGTSVSFNFRTGNSPTIDTTWSNFGDEIVTSNSLFDVFEPRKYIQYRVKLTTSNLLSPLVDKVKINFDTKNIVSGTDAKISPQNSTILKENEFTFSIDAVFDQDDYGIDTLLILTPSPATLLSVSINGVNASYLPSVNASRLLIAFNATIKTTSRIDVKFLCTPFLGVTPFLAKVSSKSVNNNPQRVDSKVQGNVEAWSIITTGVPEKLLIGVKSTPNPFTPNFDGTNDITNIEFFLGNIGEPKNEIGNQVRQITIKVYDLTGRLIKDLYDGKTSASAFIADKGITWDGRDNSGKIVRPGLYLYQVLIDSDNGGENITKTIAVTY